MEQKCVQKVRDNYDYDEKWRGFEDFILEQCQAMLTDFTSNG